MFQKKKLAYICKIAVLICITLATFAVWAIPQDVMRDFENLRLQLHSNPSDYRAMNSLGILYAQNDQLSDAIAIWRNGLRVNPRYIHFYNNLGTALEEIGRIGEARIMFKTGLSIQQNHLIYYNLGRLEQKIGNLARARTNFNRALELNPYYSAASERLSNMGYNVQNPVVVPPAPIKYHKPPVSYGYFENLPEPEMPKNLPEPSKPFVNASEKIQKRPASKPSQHVPFEVLTVEEAIELIGKIDVPVRDRVVALTFDDGPHRTNTIEILDILKKKDVKATFFVLGNRAEMFPEIIERMAKDGHDVGNHSWNHISLTKHPLKTSLANLQRTANLISSLTKKPCILVRPPYGDTNSQVRQMVRNQGWHEILWDTDSRDWQIRNPARVFRKVVTTSGPGSVILFHDNHSVAAQILPDLIKVFKANNYKFVTVSELLEMKASS